MTDERIKDLRQQVLNVTFGLWIAQHANQSVGDRVEAIIRAAVDEATAKKTARIEELVALCEKKDEATAELRARYIGVKEGRAALQESRTKAEQERDATRAECDALRDLLREIEWSGDPGWKECPACHSSEHTPTCRLAAALAKHSGGKVDDAVRDR